MGVGGVSEQTPQLGLYTWEDGADPYKHVELYQNWNNIDTNLLRKRWVKAGDEASQIRFGATGTATLAATALILTTVTGTADSKNRMTITVGGSVDWGPGANLNLDTNLYRAGTGILRTSTEFQTGGSVNSDGGFRSFRAGTASEVLGAGVTGDAAARYSVDAAGVQKWGAGGGVGDTNLYRAGADELKTDDSFTVGSGSVRFNDFPLWRSQAGRLTAGGDLKVTGNIIVDGSAIIGGSSLSGISGSFTDFVAITASITSGTVGNLVVNNSAVFNSSSGSTTFNNGFNIAGITFSRPGAGTASINATVSSSGLVATGRVLANNGASTQVAIGTYGGSPAITFGNSEDAHIRRNGSNSLYTPGNFTIGGDLGLTGLNINNPPSSVQQLNVNGDIWLPDGGDIYFGNTSKASGAGNRMVISYSAGNGYIDVASGSLNIRNNTLQSMATLSTGGALTVTALYAATAQLTGGIRVTGNVTIDTANLICTGGSANFGSQRIGAGDIFVQDISATTLTTSSTIYSTGKITAVGGLDIGAGGFLSVNNMQPLSGTTIQMHVGAVTGIGYLYSTNIRTQNIGPTAGNTVSLGLNNLNQVKVLTADQVTAVGGVSSFSTISVGQISALSLQHRDNMVAYVELYSPIRLSVQPGSRYFDMNGGYILYNNNTANSDAALKTDFAEVDEEGIWRAFKELDVKSWRWNDDTPIADGKRHIGPTYQEFVEKFGIGNVEATDAEGRSHKMLGLLDMVGVLYKMNTILVKKVEDLESKLGE